MTSILDSFVARSSQASAAEQWMQWEEPLRADPAVDYVVGQAEFAQLQATDDSVLPRCSRRHRGLHPARLTFTAYIAAFVDLAAHEASTGCGSSGAAPQSPLLTLRRGLRMISAPVSTPPAPLCLPALQLTPRRAARLADDHCP